MAGEEGVGWAVGDHGAIVTRGGGVGGTETLPARRGAKSTPQSLSRGAFDRHRAPVTDEPGTVPALRPGTVPVEPGFYDGQNPTGSSANQIVMSRDGTEGWAFGSNDIYHYDGQRWARCDPKGVGNLLPPDPACVEAPTNVTTLVRIPLERDSDPTNDDEFEAAALIPSAVYRYKDGRWSLDEKLSQGLPASASSIAFTSPDDGWVVRDLRSDDPGATATPSTWARPYHFGGERWVQCWAAPPAKPPEECGDEARRTEIQIPCGGTTSGLVAAGERVYLFSVREVGRNNSANACTTGTVGGIGHVDQGSLQGQLHPVILYRDRDGEWTGGVDGTPNDGTYNPTDGGWDPGCVEESEDSDDRCVASAEAGDRSHKGRIDSLSVAQNADSTYSGWATGTFGGADNDADALMMRLSDGREMLGANAAGTVAWRPWTLRDAADDYLRYPGASVSPRRLLALPAEAGRRNAFMFASGSFPTVDWGAEPQGKAPALGFDQERGRWTAIPTPWSVSPLPGSSGSAGNVETIAADNRGGFWASIRAFRGFHHYTDRAPNPVFAETPNPTAGGARPTALGAGADGTVWLGDANGGVYRYDRLAGWSARVESPGWEPERATRRTPVNAVAVGLDGSGVAVGNGGRIANLGERVGLDPAATIGCENQPVPPCGTGRDLLAAAISPDGSAIVAGRNRTLLWRPPGGGFRPVASPKVPQATPIVEVSMPSPERAYLLTGAGHANKPAARVIRGEMSAPGRWDWTIELGDSEGAPDPLTALGGFPGHGTIQDIALDAFGRGYAVGTNALVLERTGDGGSTWRRIPNGDRSSLVAVALPAGGGEGALIGGSDIFTLAGNRFEVAHLGDPFDARPRGIAELALTPGYASGEVEAWALASGGALAANPAGTRGLLHHPADPADPRLDPTRGLASLSDSSKPTPGEISFAAFGKQDCDATDRSSARGGGQFANRHTCGPPDGSTAITADLVNRRIREEVAASATERAVPQFALFTGDAVDGPGGRPVSEGIGAQPGMARTPFDANLKHRRWVEVVAEPLGEHGVATLGAIGGQDLTRNVEYCARGFLRPHLTLHTGGPCFTPSQAGAEQLGAQAGPNLAWRSAIASVPAPWEGEQEASGLRFERVGAGVLSQKGPDARTPAMNSGFAVHVSSYDLDAGDTHYAVDAIDEATDEKVARIVVVDTSMRSLAASDPQQHPIEAGGQLRWLDEVLCFEGSAEDTDGDVRDCTREPGQQAIVLSNTPTYSYGPISPDETQTDAAAFEAILLKNRVNVVVSGRLGWNGRYWAVAPGVHAPCPGQAYRSDAEAPSISRPEICGASSVGGTQGVVPDPSQLIQELPEDAKQAAGLAGRGAIPFVVSSSAGGTFNTKAAPRWLRHRGEWLLARLLRRQTASLGRPREDDRRAAPDPRLGGARRQRPGGRTRRAARTPKLRPRGLRPGHSPALLRDPREPGHHAPLSPAAGEPKRAVAGVRGRRFRV